MGGERVIVVGAGGISNAWLPHLKSEGLEVVAVVDLNRETAERQVAKYKLDAAVETDLDAALARGCDFVIDLTVPEAHCEVTCKALEAGCHVLGEKPMAASMDEARRMVQTAERTGRMYMVSQSRRWEVHHESVRQAVAAEAIGQLTTVNCDFYLGAHFTGFRVEMPSPLILDMAIHHFDMARMMSGKDPLAVYAHEFNPAGSWYAGDAAASCIFEMTDGVVFTYCGSWCAEGYQTSWNGDWQLIGSDGGLRYAQDAPPTVVHPDEGSQEFIYPRSETPVEPADVPAATMLGALREMLSFLREGRRPQTECHDNIKSLAMVFAAMESSRKRERIEIRV